MKTWGTCGNCRFHVVGPDHCRRFPPKALNGNQSTFPVVLTTWSACGEHKPASEAQMKRKDKEQKEWQKKQEQAAQQQPAANPQ